MKDELLDLLEIKVEEALLATAKPITDFVLPPDGHHSELLKRRFLCRGGGLLFVGPTGIGKSTLTLQMAIQWSLGFECFGIHPARPLKILLIQAENDEGDVAEMWTGIAGGLGLADDHINQLRNNFLVLIEDSESGISFCENVLKPQIRKHRPDLVIIDPVLAYLGGDVNNQQEVGNFLRKGISPILHEMDCGIIIVHHTNKPPSGAQKADWSAGDFAYLGSGSAEWGNWSRGAIALRSIGSTDIFELRLGKRGKRIGWKDEAGAAGFAKLIRHSRSADQLCWGEVTADDATLIRVTESRSKRRSPTLTLDSVTVLLNVPETGTVSKAELDDRLRSCGYSVKAVGDRIRLMLERGELVEVPVPRPGVRPAMHVKRPSPMNPG